ncbi:MAG: DNA primase [Oscillospiraceae bacterium]|nr:DNA primase [Oscillospiraceae bacterium]
MAFPASFLDELSARNPIEDVVGQYVSLTRKSSNLFGLCPFHSEKTGSFSVAPEKGIYYCFGCHKGGGVVNFIMEIENLDYPDAVRFLAKRANMEVPEDESYRNRYKSQERLKNLCLEAARFFRSQLTTPEAQVARDYLNKRGLSIDTVKKFGLGYAPNAWSALKDAMSAKGFSWEEMIEVGLAVKHPTKNSVYDYFRNRLMFPIIDVRGNVIGFGGRVLDDSKPKYLNSPETVIFNKRRNLFALNEAKKSKEKFIILTEGYMDAIALHQYGFDCAVASLGTAFTEEHAQLLAKYTEKVILTYDGDEAGQSATRRAIPMLEKAGLTVKVLQMQGAKDPDEFLKTYGPDAFRSLLNKSENQAEYHLRSIQKKYDLTKDDQRVAFLKEAAKFIATLRNAVEREIYGHRAAEAAGVNPETIKIEVDKAYRRQEEIRRKKQETQDLSATQSRQPAYRGIRYDNVRSAMAEEGLLRMLYQEPSLFTQVHLTQEQFSSSLLGRAYLAFRTQQEEGREVSFSSLGEEFTKDEIAHLSSVLQKNRESVSEQALQDYIMVIHAEYQKRLPSGEAQLRALQERKKNAKGYGG